MVIDAELWSECFNVCRDVMPKSPETSRTKLLLGYTGMGAAIAEVIVNK